VNCRRGGGRGLRIALPLLGLLIAAAAPADREADLERLQEAIKSSRERVAAFEKEHRNLLETLEALDRAAIALEREVGVARASADAARADLAAVEAEASDLAERLRATETAMARRAVALYKSGDAAAVRMLFSAGGIREFLARSSLLRRLLQRDGALLDRHKAESRALEVARGRAALAPRPVPRPQKRCSSANANWPESARRSSGWWHGFTSIAAGSAQPWSNSRRLRVRSRRRFGTSGITPRRSSTRSAARPSNRSGPSSTRRWMPR